MKRFGTLKDIFAWKREDMDAVRDRIREAVSETEAHDALRGILLDCTGNSGKMLRPLMFLMAAEDYRESQRDELLWSAAAAEILHTSSLLLDDIIDGADLRRGRPSVQAQHGVPVAMCAANYLMATAYACLCDRGYVRSARDLMRVTQCVCDGEALQDENRWNAGVSAETCLRAIAGKTASVFAFACGVASRISGHDERTQRLMRRFGEVAGTMFQIRDDILDWTMDPRRLGKPSGEDFVNGIYTLPAIYAFQSAEHGAALRAMAAKRAALAPDELEQVRERIDASGGLDRAKDDLTRLAVQAGGILVDLPANAYTAALSLLVRLFSY